MSVTVSLIDARSAYSNVRHSVGRVIRARARARARPHKARASRGDFFLHNAFVSAASPMRSPSAPGAFRAVLCFLQQVAAQHSAFGHKRPQPEMDKLGLTGGRVSIHPRMQRSKSRRSRTTRSSAVKPGHARPIASQPSPMGSVSLHTHQNRCSRRCLWSGGDRFYLHRLP